MTWSWVGSVEDVDMSEQAETPESADMSVGMSAAIAVALPPTVASKMRWYVVHAYSGMEKAVERNLRERIERSDLQGKFGRILVPMEEVVELTNGKKAVTERRFFPGYVLVEMEMADDSWHLVKHTNKVTGFVGGAKNRPSPMVNGDSAPAWHCQKPIVLGQLHRCYSPYLAIVAPCLSRFLQ